MAEHNYTRYIEVKIRGRLKELPPPDDSTVGSGRSSKKWQKLSKVADPPKSGGSSIKQEGEKVSLKVFKKLK